MTKESLPNAPMSLSELIGASAGSNGLLTCQARPRPITREFLNSVISNVLELISEDDFGDDEDDDLISTAYDLPPAFSKQQ
jgi:hypothetical protein